MNEKDPTMFDLQKVAVDFGAMERHHYVPGTERRETNVEHSYSVAMLCWYIYNQVQPDLDMSLILKYALIHDLVELYAGDINTFASDEERAQKVVDEHYAMSLMLERFSEFEDLSLTLKNYHEQADQEAVFVRTIDKMQPLILGDLDNWRCYAEYSDGISFEAFCQKYELLLLSASPYVEEVFRSLIDYCKSTYYDKPENTQT
jgi:5'-deoxynucleotidase YfbR-like HD superfamily hydrolase